MAMGRAMDEQVIEALVGNAFGSTGDSASSGSSSSSSIALPDTTKIAINDTTFEVDGGSSTSRFDCR